MHCGQPWRAACLLGWIPNHDPNYTNPLTDTKLPIEGNPNRSLWKLCAWELSQDKRIGKDLFDQYYCKKERDHDCELFIIRVFFRIISKYFNILKFFITSNLCNSIIL